MVRAGQEVSAVAMVAVQLWWPWQLWWPRQLWWLWWPWRPYSWGCGNPQEEPGMELLTWGEKTEKVGKKHGENP